MSNVSDAVGCRICGHPMGDYLNLGTARTTYAVLPLCNAHLAALNLGEWWLTIRLMDNTATISGKQAGMVADDLPDL